MEYDKPAEDNNQLNEPAASYGVPEKMKLRIFSSFEESNEADAMDAATQDPVERLRETVERILGVYGVTREQITARHKNLTVNITRRK